MTEHGKRRGDPAQGHRADPQRVRGGRSQPAATTRATRVVVGLSLAVAIVGVATFALYRNPRAIAVEVTGYSVHPTDVVMTFAITKAYDAQATCVLQALDRYGAVSGRLTGYVIGPQANHHRVSVHTATIPTTTTAVTAQVESCIITRDH